MFRSLALASWLLGLAVPPALAQDTIRVSVDSMDTEADDHSAAGRRPATSGGAKALVVFQSWATNLVAKDLNDKSDVFLRDLVAGTTTRIVLDRFGNETDGDSFNPSITPDGRYVIFNSLATALVKSDTNACHDVFVLDRTKGSVERVSVDDAGVEGDADSILGMISDDGRYVSFFSNATNLVANDGNGRPDVFLRDRTSGTTICLSVDPSGVPGDLGGSDHWLTPDGAYVAIASDSTNLVPNDTNGWSDVFVRDLAAGVTTRVSLNEGGYQLDRASRSPSISADGSLVMFDSFASNLHPDVPTTVTQVYVKSLLTGELWLASRGVDGQMCNGFVTAPRLLDAANGSSSEPVVAFWTNATNFPDDGLDDTDLFAVRVWSGVSQCLTVDSNGIDTHTTGNNIISGVGITPEGDAVYFGCTLPGLVPNDANGVGDVFRRGVQWTACEEFGDGLAGSGGDVPHLTGRGGSCEAGRWSIQIEDGLPQAFGHLWVSLGRTNGLPLFGGTFYLDFSQLVLAVPILLDGPLGVFGAGELLFDDVNVENVGDFSLFLQCTFLDPLAPKGVSISNALELAIDA